MLEILKQLTGTVTALSGGAAAASVAVVLEIILRVIPSKKPLSIAYFIDDAAHAIGDLAKAVGDGLDKILPNRTK